MSKKLIFRVAPDGKVVSEAQDYQGEGCLAALTRMLAAAGLTPQGEPTLKDEFYQRGEDRSLETLRDS